MTALACLKTRLQDAVSTAHCSSAQRADVNVCHVPSSASSRIARHPRPTTAPCPASAHPKTQALPNTRPLTDVDVRVVPMRVTLQALHPLGQRRVGAAVVRARQEDGRAGLAWRTPRAACGRVGCGDRMVGPAGGSAGREKTWRRTARPRMHHSTPMPQPHPSPSPAGAPAVGDVRLNRPFTYWKKRSSGSRAAGSMRRRSSGTPCSLRCIQGVGGWVGGWAGVFGAEVSA